MVQALKEGNNLRIISFLLMPRVFTHRIWKNDKSLINELRPFNYLMMARKKFQSVDGKEIMRKISSVHD